MSVLDGYNKYKRYIKTNDGYKLCSQWTSSNTVQMDDGNTLQTNLGAINGITDSLTATSSNIAASAAAVKTLNDSLNSIQVISVSKSVTRTANQSSAEIFIPDIPYGYKLICACGFALGSANFKNSSMYLTSNDTAIRMDIYNTTSSTITANCTAYGLCMKTN